MVASKLLRLAAAAATTAVVSCLASPVICRGVRSTAPVSRSLSSSSAAAATADMFSPPQTRQHQHQQQQQQQQQQQWRSASAARLGRLASAAGVRRPRGRFHALTGRSATASSSREGSLFTRGGGLEEGGVPRAQEEENDQEDEEEGEDTDANDLPAEACSGGADLGLSESDPQVWEIISAERRRQVGGRMSDARSGWGYTAAVVGVLSAVGRPRWRDHDLPQGWPGSHRSVDWGISVGRAHPADNWKRLQNARHIVRDQSTLTVVLHMPQTHDSSMTTPRLRNMKR